MALRNYSSLFLKFMSAAAADIFHFVSFATMNKFKACQEHCVVYIACNFIISVYRREQDLIRIAIMKHASLKFTEK